MVSFNPEDGQGKNGVHVTETVRTKFCQVLALLLPAQMYLKSTAYARYERVSHFAIKYNGPKCFRVPMEHPYASGRVWLC